MPFPRALSLAAAVLLASAPPTASARAADGLDCDVRSAHFTFCHPPQLAPLADELQRSAEAELARILEDLGPIDMPVVRVLLARDHAQMRSLAPPGIRVPVWAAGMALSRQDAILLKVVGEQGQVSDTRQVFVHELAHLALDRAVGGAKIPRWFHEGFAIHHAGEWSVSRSATLAHGALAGRLFSLQALTDSFPTRPPDVELAYAQSIDFVAYLLHHRGKERFWQLVELLRRGWPFLLAMEEAYDEGIFRIEADWRADVEMRFTWIPLLTGTATLWTLATLVLVAAWLRKRRARRLAVALMGELPEDDLPPPPLSPTSP
ncbi:MAG: hypothetical protein JXR96_12535 [Deltaproteobacteria bacterium]|nr:hypothetical protein [Deltaproteobacteria bacterium]